MVAGGGLTTGYYHFTDEDASDFLIPKPSSGKSGFVSECLAFLTFFIIFSFIYFLLLSSRFLFSPLPSSVVLSFFLLLFFFSFLSLLLLCLRRSPLLSSALLFCNIISFVRLSSIISDLFSEAKNILFGIP